MPDWMLDWVGGRNRNAGASAGGRTREQAEQGGCARVDARASTAERLCRRLDARASTAERLCKSGRRSKHSRAVVLETGCCHVPDHCEAGQLTANRREQLKHRRKLGSKNTASTAETTPRAQIQHSRAHGGRTSPNTVRLAICPPIGGNNSSAAGSTAESTANSAGGAPRQTR